jgi:hypothetical protein
VGSGEFLVASGNSCSDSAHGGRWRLLGVVVEFTVGRHNSSDDVGTNQALVIPSVLAGAQVVQRDWITPEDFS